MIMFLAVILALVALLIVMPSSNTSEYDLGDQGAYVCRSEWGWFYSNKVKECVRLR